MALLQALLKYQGEAIASNKIQRQRALVKITPIERKVERDAFSLLKKLAEKVEADIPDASRNAIKVRDHARRTI